MAETQANAEKRIIGKPFEVGNPGGPGRPALTEEQKIIKKEVKKWLQEYEEGLAEALPSIRPVLIEQAKKGNIKAFGEIHKVLGAHKGGANVGVAVQVNIGQILDELENE